MDIFFVYNFFRNVCKNVIFLKWGWGYELFVDDVSLGVDIERICLMWNRYCDGEMEFLYFREIFVRMIDWYGNILDFVKFEDIGRIKILSKCIKLDINICVFFIIIININYNFLICL